MNIKAIIFFCAVFLGLGLIIFIQNTKINKLHRQTESDKASLLRKDREHLDNILRIDRLERVSRQKDSVWLNYTSKLRDSLKVATMEKNKWRIKYAADKKSPVTHFTESQLDTIISGLIGHH